MRRRNHSTALFIGVTLCCFVFLLYCSSGNGRDSKIAANAKSEERDVEMACRIPKLEQNRPEVMQFYRGQSSLSCPGEHNWVFVDQEGRLQLTEEAIKKHGQNVKCSVEYILRVSDEHITKKTANDMIGKKIEESDFFTAQCRAGSSNWEGMLMTVVRNETKVKNLKTKKQPKDWSGLNVYFFGLDSLSQMAYRRSLPKTVEYFEKEMKGVVLDGYNIVGDGTPQAFIPILTSQTEVELPLTRKRFSNANYVDVYPFIWNNFSDAGYVTLYGEDMAHMGVYSHRMKGFKEQPSDHYVRTFFQEAERRHGNLNCIGSEPMHNVWMKYGNEFIERYSDVPRFELLFHGRLSHDHVNLVSVMDDDFAANLKKLHTSGAFKNTLVVIMADHGHRFAELRNTHQGQLEERLPFFGIYLPEEFRESEKGKTAYENLKNNAHRLSTPFDIYSTLWDVLKWPSNQALAKMQPLDRRSLSLFRPIPPERTCEMAGIEPHWCTCLNWEPVPLNGTSLMIAKKIVDEINAQTEPERKLCAKLELKKLFDAKRLVPPKQMMSYLKADDIDGEKPNFGGKAQVSSAHYQVKFETTPGGAIYEATVLYDSSSGESGSVKVDFKSISHVNQYGDKPHCIIDKNYFLGAYCICYDKIEKN
ncbi:hypothetical protein QR680_006898 [Steinernema hermaphroditum]|uniref:Sulfatase N-terminal domain-containing protein n=1 Tax=Steinernema hermaphroditum TaxID=289476 RepID=A0AA39HWU6_9BILA|nr:hypothetical protein QR680_006898 [Steinernema hermaphroditum]